MCEAKLGLWMRESPEGCHKRAGREKVQEGIEKRRGRRGKAEATGDKTLIIMPRLGSCPWNGIMSTENQSVSIMPDESIVGRLCK